MAALAPYSVRTTWPDADALFVVSIVFFALLALANAVFSFHDRSDSRSRLSAFHSAVTRDEDHAEDLEALHGSAVVFLPAWTYQHPDFPQVEAYADSLGLTADELEVLSVLSEDESAQFGDVLAAARSVM